MKSKKKASSGESLSKVSSTSEVKKHLKGDIRDQKHGIVEDKKLMKQIKAVKKIKK